MNGSWYTYELNVFNLDSICTYVDAYKGRHIAEKLMSRKFKTDDGNVIHTRNKWIERCWILNLMTLKASFMHSIYIKICLTLKGTWIQ